MTTLASNRNEYAPDPLSPFQPSNPSDNKKLGNKTTSNPAKSDLEFIQKVTNSTGTENLFWDQTAKASHAMAKSSLSSSTEKTKKAVHAFNDLRRRCRVKEEFSHFCSETSFTALTRIYKASSWRRQVGWTLLLLAMLGWLSVQCYWLLDKYFSYPSEVRMDILAAKELDFPSVTVCNLNPVKKSAVEHAPEFASLIHFTDMINDDDVLYEYTYNNYDSVFSAPAARDTVQWPTQTQSTQTAPQTQPASSVQTSPPTQTQPQTSMTQTSNTQPQQSMSTSPDTPPPPGPGSPSRKRRSVVNDEADLNVDPALDVHVFDHHPHHYTPSEDRNNDNAGDEDSKQDSFWVALERELFGEEVEEGQGGRFRRMAQPPPSSGEHSERLDFMKNNSFNKWDVLDNGNANISYYETRGAEYKAAMAYATVTAELPQEVVQAAGHQLTDFLLTCRFNGWQCSPKNFTHFTSHKFGNCFTFNSHEFTRNLETKFAGPEYGLTLEMYIQQDQYVPALAAEAGVRVLIHPKGKWPFPEDEGISIPPQRSTSISIRKVEIIRLDPPHGTCDERGSSLDLYAQNYNATYSKLSCLKSCYQSIVQRHCNCSMPMYYVADRTTVCNMTEDDVDMCTSNLPNTVPDEYSQCDRACPQPCFELEYDMLVSSAAWPSEPYEDYLENKLKQSNYLLMDGKDADNFVKLNVYFKDLMYEKVEQQEGYESQNLISDIGGQLGLWLGLSAITIGELCGLILSLFRSLTSVSPSKNDNSFSTPVKPFSKDLEPDSGATMMSDVKSRGFV